MKQLFFREVGQGSGTPLLILHGLFGTSDNWHNIARNFAEDGHHVVVADLRNHGLSFHDDTFTYPAMAEDVARLITHLGLPKANIIGHSMGGKVTMHLALDYPELLHRIVVADIAPKAYPVHHHQIIAGLQAMPVQAIKSRKEADDALAQYVPEAGVRQFLLKNLARDKAGGYNWKMNLPVIISQIENVGQALPAGNTIDLPALFIRGGKSDYILDEDEALLARHFSQYSLQTLANAGHWVHAEQPAAFLAMVKAFLAV